MATKKELTTKRDEMRMAIKQHPGITSTEIAGRVGVITPTLVTSALWKDLRSGRIRAELVERNGRKVNTYYMPEDLPADAVERIQQHRVDARDKPITKPTSARNSVFDVPGTQAKPRRAARRAPVSMIEVTPSAPMSFACAITSDGRLVLMRDGSVEVSLTENETLTVQACLMKLAAAKFFASMA